jgi:hypothetical protein
MLLMFPNQSNPLMPSLQKLYFQSKNYPYHIKPKNEINSNNKKMKYLLIIITNIEINC